MTQPIRKILEETARFLIYKWKVFGYQCAYAALWTAFQTFLISYKCLIFLAKCALHVHEDIAEGILEDAKKLDKGVGGRLVQCKKDLVGWRKKIARAYYETL